MVVITLINCPDALRGDLTKWLTEINAGVFVGQVNARIRERLWERVCSHTGKGRATMVFSAATEQRLDFRVANSEWTPVDFDGIRLMARPDRRSSEISGESSLRPGYSKAAQRLQAHRMAASRLKSGTAKCESRDKMLAYVVIDLETTGLSPDKDEIIEMSALRVRDDKVVDSYSVLVKTEMELPVKIIELTGITGDMLRTNGGEPRTVLEEFLAFIGTEALVAHNAGFDMSFLNAACRKNGLPRIQNRCVDTLPLSKRQVRDLRSYGLKSLAEYFKLNTPREMHRGLADCEITKLLYEKLIYLD